jgi:hypothetical protein
MRLDYGFISLAARSLAPAAEAFMALAREIDRDIGERNRALLDEVFQGLELRA